MGHRVLLHLGQGTSSCPAHLQESQGHKTHQVLNLFILALASLLGSVGGGSVLPTSRTTGHLLYAKGSPKPQLLLTRRSLAEGLGTQPVPYKWGFSGAWFCQKMRAQMLEIPWERQEGSVPSQHPSNIPAFLPSSPSGSPCPKQQWGGPHLQAVLVRKDQTFPRGEAPRCCRPSCSHWLQRE